MRPTAEQIDELDDGQAGIVKMLLRNGGEITRERFIAANWPTGAPQPWGAEEEEQVPAFLQDWGKVSSPVIGEDDQGAQS